MSNFVATLQDNWMLILGAMLAGAVLLAIGYEAVKSKTAQKAESAASSAASHVKAALSKAKTHAEAVIEEIRPAAAPAPAVPTTDPVAAHAALDATIAQAQAVIDAAKAAKGKLTAATGAAVTEALQAAK